MARSQPFAKKVVATGPDPKAEQDKEDVKYFV
jgi:hypothetical protein